MLSAKQIRELESYVRKFKVVQEEAAKSLEDFERKIIELFKSKEISYKEYSKIITRISAPSHHVLDENNLSSQLDDIIRLTSIRAAAPLFAIDEILRSGEWIDLFVVLKDLGFSLNTLFEKPLPSVDIVGTRIRGQPISKAIDNLLYTYTPFKLRGGRREDYTILLLPSIRGDSIDTKWFSNEIDYFYEDDVKVITPDEVRPTNINEIHSLIYVNGEQYFRLEVDQRIRDGVYYCRMGQYISPLRNCNRHKCWLWSACNGKKFWSRTPRSFYSIAKVSPNIEVKVNNYEKPEELLCFRNILTFEKIDELLAKIYIASVSFMSRYMIRNPLIKLKETIGYRINTKSVALAINASWLKRFVKALLLRDSMLYAWIYTKYFIWSNFDVNDVRKLSRFFWNLIVSKKDAKIKRFEKGLQTKSISEDLVTFACKVLLHTMAHMMHEEIVAVLQTASDNIVYAYSQNPETDGNFRIFLFENAKRGLGLTESFTSRIREGGEKIVTDMIDKMVERIRSCSMEITPSVFIEDASGNVKTILNRLESYNRVLNTSYGISVPVEIARYILAREDRTTSKLIDKEDVSAFIDDILSTMPLCWDGCYQCVRLETDCHKPPYEQMFLVSKLLLIALLNEWRGTFVKLVTIPTQTVISELPVVEIGEARNLFNYIMSARKSVKLISPWISEEVARTLYNLATEKKINFQILTSLDVSVGTHKNALKFFMKTRVPEVEVRVIKNKPLHAKLFLIDESSLIVGSANLTLSGLYENIESYAVLSNKDIIAESLTKFQELWNNANSLENSDI